MLVDVLAKSVISYQLFSSLSSSPFSLFLNTYSFKDYV
ncbi:phosphate transport ATP-binding protein PstB [Microcystis sp. 0824]|nr:phosphate transport ATP-binding protein PstB [Microcystis sp. 0824]